MLWLAAAAVAALDPRAASSQHASCAVAVWQDSKLAMKGSDPSGESSGQITGLQVAGGTVLSVEH